MKPRNKRRYQLSVPEKTNRLLSGIIVTLAVIALRLWHLAVIEHDQKFEEAYKPQTRIIPEMVERATICDRFGKTLAENKIQYDVSVVYSAIRDLPSRAWCNKDGEKQLVPVRRRYITRLAELLSEELHLDKDMIEDSIHAKASVLGSVPYLIQKNVSERTYLKLQMLAKDWPGLHVESKVRRFYPQGRTAADILGYVGPISSEEYKRITCELSKLRECVRAYEEGEDPKLPKGLSSIDEVRSLLSGLENNAYNLNALVGKLGIEALWDGKLRGQIGKKTVLVDRRGNFIQELDGAVSVTPGRRLQLTISTELQEFADALLVEHERTDQMRSAQSLKKQNLLPPLFPWIKGGAIVAFDPNNGQVLAMASSPRYHNNDFINMKISPDDSELKSTVCRWLENSDHIGDLYDRKIPLRRERKDSLSGKYYEEELPLTFDYFLDFLLPNTSEVKATIKRMGTVGNALKIQEYMDALLQLFDYSKGCCSCSAIFDAIFPKEEGHLVTGEILSIKQQQWIAECCTEHVIKIEEIKNQLITYFSDLPANYDKILLVDLFRIVIDPKKFNSDLLEEARGFSLSEFIEYQGRYVALRSAFSKIVEDIFYEVSFKQWREKHFPKLLDEKRREEKARKQRYPTPYIDYLLEEKRSQYREFCKCYLDVFLVYLLTGDRKCEHLQPYYDALALWRQELENGAHKALPWYEHYIFLKQKLTNASLDVYQLLLSFREFSELQRPVFGKYPLTLTRNSPQKEQDLVAAFYPAYGYGYLRPHSFGQAATLGSIFKLVSAYSVLSQKAAQENYVSDDLSKLLVIIDRKSFGYVSYKPHVGFFSDGSIIPSFYKGGSLPGNDYAGRGYIDLISALEMSSNPYFSLLVSEYLMDPEDLCHAASLFGFGEKTGIGLPGEYAGSVPSDVAYNRSGLYATAIGQHTLVVTPLQTAVMMGALVNGGLLYTPNLVLGEWDSSQFYPSSAKVKRQVFMPEVVADLFKAGMHKVIWGRYGTTRSIKDQFPAELLSRIIGKTSTAESMIRVGVDRQYGNMKMKHVWFGAVGFSDQELKSPEIVVVVYLRLGEFGRDAAPMAVKMIEKWEQIKRKEKIPDDC
ncbi:penicillin binding transpeptidase domain protein [Chlamydia ibidis]|uniref:Penicillin binding transpeptidase domain protein n=2 Tax=Chlamydia ibidis TaxID=1405396 RepID=S7KEC3_9CHLA|nr:penicillin-binding transpeptidase domain-containing protein [Chlamydia ibidis]EPP34556.1 penicillin binding transpeptidase domain protein [Chlamydia ibidis]EQM63138.1 penicillin binding transpeptidase domain protein [Chlamydia ibidis 10-1398/6]